MRAAPNTIALAADTDRSVGRAATSDAFSLVTTDRSFVKGVMRGARDWFRHKPSVELAAIVGCPLRTAERYFSGDRTPDAVALMKLLRSPYGVRLVQAATRTLPSDQAKAFWEEMGLAVIRAAHRRELEE